MTDPSDMKEMNARLIDEFRANDGKVASFGDNKLLVLHTIGAKSGIERVSMMVYQDLGGSYAVFASAGGAPTHPAWFHNIVAHPHVEIELGATTLKAKARVAEGIERQTIWDQQQKVTPVMDGYAARAGRTIPVIVLDPEP